MILTIIIVFISLIGLIILHELGHFVVAKRFGVKVEEFGIFLPPRLIGKKIGETVYSLNLLPFGAFVKIYGEEGGVDEASPHLSSRSTVEDGRSFSGKPIWQRVLIVIGGVVVFWIIAAILLSIVMGLGAQTAVSDQENGRLVDPKIQIVAVAPNSPAEEAGINPGDTIKKFLIFSPATNFENQNLGGQDFQFPIDKVKELQALTEQYKGQEVTLTIERRKEIFDVSLTPRVKPPEGEGAMGVVLVRTALKSYPWYQAPIKGAQASIKLTGAIIMGLAEVLGSLVLGKGLPPGAQLMGPVGIGTLMTQFAQMGINYYLHFIALISIYLAIFNILPIPALDGGKLLFLGIEAVRRKPVSFKIEQKITVFFFTLLITLLIWVTIKDIASLF